MDVCEHAYTSDLNIQNYLRFFVAFSKKESRSYHGRYFFKTKTIELCNFTRGSNSIVITALHELAHHIDYCQRGTTDHKMQFYAIYKHLVHTALDMKIISKSEILNIDDSSDSKKIKKFLDDYVMRAIDYKNDKITIRCTNCFEQRQTLKSIGFHYEATSKSWNKEILKSDVDKTKKLIKSLNSTICLELISANSISLELMGEIVLNGNTFEFKEKLKGLGYQFQDKKWRKKIKVSNFNLEKSGVGKVSETINCKLEYK